jgi:SPP1 family predicted phage head-tail adaptor
MPSGRPVNVERRVSSAGRRNRQITIEQRAQTKAPSGMPIEEWAPLAVGIWASREDVTAGEQYGMGQESAFLETHWNIPYRADCDPELVDVPASRRVTDRGRVYDIRGAALVNHRESITLLTQAKADA